VRVYTLAKTIGELEKLSEEEQENLELAAVVHNVEGEERIPAVRDILSSCGVAPETSMRVCHIIENMDNYEHISSLDHQIFIEARMIVEFKEQGTSEDEIVRFAEKRFITNYGKMFLKRAFDV
jgi:predicted metal-dependent phosphotriesterase family hydrolase